MQRAPDRVAGWLGTISQTLDDSGPVSFDPGVIREQPDLFAHRAALFYTPTESIPTAWVGTGPLDVTLPIPTPDYTDLMEIRAYRSPRFWVDLLQRQTGKLRWTPMIPARVAFFRYDRLQIRDDHLHIGTKALMDALKLRTTGRRDGRELHYFGAIHDDSSRFITAHWAQRLVRKAREARIRIIVTPLVANQTVQRTEASRLARRSSRTSSAAGSRR